MTTSKAVWHKDPQGFKDFMSSPEVRAQAEAAADSLMKTMQAAWPEGANKPTLDGVDEVFVRESHEMADGRPAEWILVNHPYAAQFEADFGFVTNAVAALDLKIAN